MRRPARAASSLAVLVAVAAAATARADALDRIGDGAPLYALARPVALIGALQRLRVDQLPAVQKMRRQMGGIDLFNPAILAAPGIDVAAPVALSLFEPAGPGLRHSRVAATLRDAATFATFLDAVAASGQLTLTKVDARSPLGKQGVMATGSLSADTTMIVRVLDDALIVDLVNSADGKQKPPAPAELARRFAARPARAFAVGHGARRLFAPGAAAVVYVDGRRLPAFLAALADDDKRREQRWASPADRQATLTRQRARDKQCAAWAHAPATFDDAALALTAAPEGLSLTWAWGTQAGAPLGGLKLVPVAEAGLDADLLARDATAVVALYAASLAPFGALKRSGLFATPETLTQAVDGCDQMAGVLLAVRSWPLAIGTFTSAKAGASSPMAAVQQSLGTLRNVVVAMRDLTQAGPRFAVAATFDAAARPMLEMLLTASGTSGAVTTIGARSPTVYPLSLPGLPHEVAAAIESLAAGKLGFTVADSQDSLSWAFRGDEAPPTTPPADASGARARPPLLRLAADMTQLAKLGPMLNLGRDEQSLLDTLARLRHVDGDLVADGDLFRLTLRAPLKQ